MCCQGCANSALSNEKTNGAFPDKIAAIFYHKQDTSIMTDQGKLCLSCMVFEQSDLVALPTIMTEVVKTFNDAGFKVDWNGSTNTRPFIWVN